MEEEATLSNRSGRELYRLYREEGWTIRQLCVKFGIIPERAKAIIYAENKYFFEIAPFQSPEQIVLDFFLEDRDDQEEENVDYGPDLDDLIHRDITIPNLSFDSNEITRLRDEMT